MTLGQKLYHRRQELGLSQSQVAGTQITRNMLSQLEHDQASPSVKTLAYLAEMLQVRLSWLLDEESVQDETMNRVRKLYADHAYEECVQLIGSMSSPSEECILLLHRSAIKQGETCLQQGKLPEARHFLDLAQKQEGTYLCSWDREQERLLALDCALSDHIMLEEAAAAAQAPLNEKQKCLLAEYYLKKGNISQAEVSLNDCFDESIGTNLYLRGCILLQKNSLEEGIRLLEQAEQKGDLSKPRKMELFKILEQYYLKKENFQLAYRYAVLRMQP